MYVSEVYYTMYTSPVFIWDNCWTPDESHAKLKVAAIRAIGCLVQNHQGKVEISRLPVNCERA